MVSGLPRWNSVWLLPWLTLKQMQQSASERKLISRMPLRHYPDSLMLWCTLSGRQLVNIPIISLTVNHLTAAHLMWEGRELRIKADILNCTAGARVKQQQCSHPDAFRSPPSLTELWMNSVNLPSQKKNSLPFLICSATVNCRFFRAVVSYATIHVWNRNWWCASDMEITTVGRISQCKTVKSKYFISELFSFWNQSGESGLHLGQMINPSPGHI